MTRSIWQSALTLTALAGVSFFAGYQFAPREILDSTVEYVGFLKVDTRRVLSATIESLKTESRLVSYSYVGTQNVEINRSHWYLFNGQQQLIVPATVSYFIDLAQFNESNVIFDEPTKTVRVTLPKLMLRVDFDPTQATTINGGMLTLSDSVVQTLTKLNYETARKSAVKQGQQAALVEAASNKTKQNIERLIRIPLQAVGQSNIKILVSFAA